MMKDMKFYYMNAEFRIRFSYFLAEDLKGLQNRVTVARLWTGERETENEQLVGEGHKWLLQNSFTYFQGRKDALRKALSHQTRSFRREAWLAYLNRHGVSAQQCDLDLSHHGKIVAQAKNLTVQRAFDQIPAWINQGLTISLRGQGVIDVSEKTVETTV